MNAVNGDDTLRLPSLGDSCKATHARCLEAAAPGDGMALGAGVTRPAAAQDIKYQK